MKKLLFLLMIPVLCFGQYTSIPDQYFEQALIDLGHDDIVDGKVITANINSLDTLIVTEKSISNLKGIEAFTSLTILGCVNTQITSLDVSKNTALIELHCGHNLLMSLDISHNTALTELDCRYNQL